MAVACQCSTGTPSTWGAHWHTAHQRNGRLLSALELSSAPLDEARCAGHEETFDSQPQTRRSRRKFGNHDHTASEQLFLERHLQGISAKDLEAGRALAQAWTVHEGIAHK